MHLKIGLQDKLISLGFVDVEFGDKRTNFVFTLGPDEAKRIIDMLKLRIQEIENQPQHPYFQQLQTNTTHTVVVASTNEPCLEESIKGWLNQTQKDTFLLFVVDCATDETWDLVRQYRKENVAFLLSPKLQGLTNVWNQAFLSNRSNFITIAPADAIPPPDYLEKCQEALQTNPKFGYVIPHHDKEDVLWYMTITRECKDVVGSLSPEFGPGGTAAIIDWRLRCEQADYTPHMLDLKINPHPYSLLDKGNADRLQKLQEKYGTDIYSRFKLTKLPFFQAPGF